MSDTARSVWGIVTSRSVAVWLLVFVTMMLAIGAILPNPELLSPADAAAMKSRYTLIYNLGQRYNSQKLAQSWAFGSIGIFLILSTALCSVDRFYKRYRSGGKAPARIPVAEEGGLRKDFSKINIVDLKEHALARLRKGRWRIAAGDSGDAADFICSRGHYGFWGSIFFHGVLITALLGMVIYYLGGYRASLSFTEGQSYALREDSFYHVEKRPVWGFRLPAVEIGLIKQFSLYSPEAPSSPTDYVARFRVLDKATGRSWDQDVRINDPLVIEGHEFLMVVGGYSPRIVIRTKNGSIVFDRYVALRGSDGTEDGFTAGSGALRVEVKLYPDYVLKGGKPVTRTIQLKNPMLQVTLRRGGDIVGEGLVPLGGGGEAGDYRITFEDVRRWVAMEMVGEPGIGFFFALLFLGVAGIAIRMIDPEETLHISLRQKDGGVLMSVTPFSRHFPGLAASKAEKFVKDLEADRDGLTR